MAVPAICFPLAAGVGVEGFMVSENQGEGLGAGTCQSRLPVRAQSQRWLVDDGGFVGK